MEPTTTHHVEVDSADVPALVELIGPAAWEGVSTIQKLDILAELQHKHDLQVADTQQAIQDLQDQLRQMAPDIFAALDYHGASLTAIEAAFFTQGNALSAAIKADVLAQAAGLKPDKDGKLKASVKGAHLIAVYNNARRSVNMARFDGYCITHPEANALVDVGEPSVTIRIIGGKS